MRSPPVVRVLTSAKARSAGGSPARTTCLSSHLRICLLVIRLQLAADMPNHEIRVACRCVRRCRPADGHRHAPAVDSGTTRTLGARGAWAVGSRRGRGMEAATRLWRASITPAMATRGDRVVPPSLRHAPGAALQESSDRVHRLHGIRRDMDRSTSQVAKRMYVPTE